MNTENHKTQRAPVVAIMGHIDHGKSTLLSYIRKSTEALNEAGGITQKVSAYEVEHTGSDGKKHWITFLDTPGHEAFSGIRRRGADVADIAVLVISAEDGVKPQTLEALRSIQRSKTPFIVAINKIDKLEANVEWAKQNLAEHEFYVEGYGGDIPVVALSAKTGEGVSELLDMILLVAEIAELQSDPIALGQGVIVESNRDERKGISATCIVKNGTVEKGMFVASGESLAPIRSMENFLGVQIQTAKAGSPVKIIGWDSMPEVGESFQVYKTRDKATFHVEKEKERNVARPNTRRQDSTRFESIYAIPLIVKADTGGSLEAVLYEIGKLSTEQVAAHVISSGIGTISENDIRLAGSGTEQAFVIGFNVKIDFPAQSLAERNNVEVKTFDIIYKLTDWLTEVFTTRTPKVKTEESIGLAKILKIFSKVRDKQILGGKVLRGEIKIGAQVKIIRRDTEIGQGKIRELQTQKNKLDTVPEGSEFGALIEAKIEIAPGDQIESFIIIEK